MEITWHGMGMFVFRGDKAILVVDPNKPFKDVQADILLISNERVHKGISLDEVPHKHLFDWPGEYEVKGTIVKSIPVFKDKKEVFRILVWEMDGIVCCFLSVLNDKVEDEILEKIGSVDILLVPVGGGEVLDGKKAHEVVEKIDPRIVLPMYYASEGDTDDFDSPEKFLKEVGKTALEAEKKLKIVKSKLPVEQTEFVLLRKE